MFPAETVVFMTIADKSADLHWRRNIVAHGFVEMRSRENASTATGHEAAFYARGSHNGRDLEISLDTDTLQKLWQDIAHLGGALLAALARMGAGIGNGPQDLVVADKDVLQGHQGEFHFLPMPTTQQRQP